MKNPPSRDEIATRYLESLPYAPYPVQEEAIYAYFMSDSGVLVCAPTGTGKTLIAEAALFEALHTGTIAYYTTPLIALTEQKFREIQEKAAAWGFSATDVGLVTGNRRENPDAKVLVVVAEILLNRLLEPARFNFNQVSAVVMDEFHSFADRERGIVWELTLGMLPKHIRLLLLSATVGNASDFIAWLYRAHGRRIELVQGTERRVPLVFHWIGDEMLNEQIEKMADGPPEARLVPSLIFCFNREECWTVAEQLKGKGLLASGQQARLLEEISKHDWSQGAGPKLKTILQRGVGVHHAGILPKYRRIVEDLFQQKLLSVATCTETLSAGINLPARSVVLPSLIKGKPGDMKLLEASAAHQIFGRAGRPQFDVKGYVIALAHEDDVKIARFKVKYDQIPEDTKDPGLLKAKKAMKKKMPTRSPTRQYWNESQFQKLQTAPPSKLYSKGPLPWRLLAHVLEVSSDVSTLRELVGKRLMEPGRIEHAQVELDRMLLTLWQAGYVELEPKPPEEKRTLQSQLLAPLIEEEPTATIHAEAASNSIGDAAEAGETRKKPLAQPAMPFGAGLFDDETSATPAANEELKNEASQPADANVEAATAPAIEETPVEQPSLKFMLGGAKIVSKVEKSPAKASPAKPSDKTTSSTSAPPSAPPAYRATSAMPTPDLAKLSHFRSVDPLYGAFLVEQLSIANDVERILAIESVLDMPGTVARLVRVPRYEELPPGPLAMRRLDTQLLQLGLATADELRPPPPSEEDEPWRRRANFEEPPKRILTLADKLRVLFDFDYPGIGEVRISPVWAAGELLEFGGDFNKYITGKALQKQEGILFRHFLRLILLCAEFKKVNPTQGSADDWQAFLDGFSKKLTEACRAVDATSTEQMLEQAASPEIEA